MYAIWKESPLVPLFLFFIFGIYTQDRFSVDLNVSATLLFLTTTIFTLIWLRNNRFLLLMSLLICSMSGYLLATIKTYKEPTPFEKQEWHALVVSTPRQTANAQFATLQLFLKDTVENSFIESTMKVEGIFLKKETAIEKGMYISFSTNLQPIYKHENNFSAYKFRNGITHKAFVYNVTSHGYQPLTWTNTITEWFNTKIINKKAFKNADIINGICFGDKTGFDKQDLKTFQHAGFMHLLAVSGMHVGFIAMICKFILGLFSKNFKMQRVAGMITILIIWAYIAIAGFTPSAVRAGIMFSTYFGTELLEHEISKYQVLAFAGIIILAFNPSDVFNIGFQLSFAAMFGITCFYRLFDQFKRSSTILKRPLDMLAVGIGAQLGTLPFCLHYFGYYPTYSLIFSLVAGIIVFGIVILVIITTVSYPVDIHGYCLPILDYLADNLKFIAQWSNNLPFSGIYFQITERQAIFLSLGLIIIGMISEIRMSQKRNMILS